MNKSWTSSHFDNLELHSFVSLWALKTVADRLHQSVNQPLAWCTAVRGVTRDMAISEEFLWGAGFQG